MQSILSKNIEFPAAENNPMNLLENPKNKLKIRIPYEKYFKNAEENFKILTNFQIYLKSGGYNAYVKTFAVFYSEQEIENIKFNSLTKRFTKIQTSADLPLLRLNILNKEEDKEAGVKIIEFDISNKSSIEK